MTTCSKQRISTRRRLLTRSWRRSKNQKRLQSCDPPVGCHASGDVSRDFFAVVDAEPGSNAGQEGSSESESHSDTEMWHFTSSHPNTGPMCDYFLTITYFTDKIIFA